MPANAGIHDLPNEDVDAGIHRHDERGIATGLAGITMPISMSLFWKGKSRMPAYAGMTALERRPPVMTRQGSAQLGVRHLVRFARIGMHRLADHVRGHALQVVA